MAFLAIYCLSLKKELAVAPSRTTIALLFTAERHSELFKQCQCLVILVRRRDERDVHPVDLLDHVVVDLGEDHLLLHAERVVTAAIERARVDATEIANPRNRHRHEPVEELPHPRTTQRHRGPDLLTLSQTEVGDRLLRLLANRTLAGDDRQLVHHCVENLRVLDRFADTAVDHDLLQIRDLMRVGETELILETVANGALVENAQTRWRNRQVLARVLHLDLLLPGIALAALAAFGAALLLLLIVFRCHDLCPRSAREWNWFPGTRADTLLASPTINV